MKTLSNTIAAIIVVAMTFTLSSGKTRNMTANQYNLHIHKVDSSIVGTWEKSWNMQQKSKDEFCQFNANGTFISFKKENGKYAVTGRGKWMAENGTISILHGNEKSTAVKYESAGNQLVFGDNVSYTKPSPAYANK
jgi:flagellin-like protein